MLPRPERAVKLPSADPKPDRRALRTDPIRSPLLSCWRVIPTQGSSLNRFTNPPLGVSLVPPYVKPV